MKRNQQEHICSDAAKQQVPLRAKTMQQNCLPCFFPAHALQLQLTSDAAVKPTQLYRPTTSTLWRPGPCRSSCGPLILDVSSTITSSQTPASFEIMVFCCFKPFNVLFKADFTSTLITAAALMLSIKFAKLLQSICLCWKLEEVLQQLLGLLLLVARFLEALKPL